MTYGTADECSTGLAGEDGDRGEPQAIDDLAIAGSASR